MLPSTSCCISVWRVGFAFAYGMCCIVSQFSKLQTAGFLGQHHESYDSCPLRLLHFPFPAWPGLTYPIIRSFPAATPITTRASRRGSSTESHTDKTESALVATKSLFRLWGPTVPLYGTKMFAFLPGKDRQRELGSSCGWTRRLSQCSPSRCSLLPLQMIFCYSQALSAVTRCPKVNQEASSIPSSTSTLAHASQSWDSPSNSTSLCRSFHAAPASGRRTSGWRGTRGACGASPLSSPSSSLSTSFSYFLIGLPRDNCPGYSLPGDAVATGLLSRGPWIWRWQVMLSPVAHLSHLSNFCGSYLHAHSILGGLAKTANPSANSMPF
jgi:hypothetical protein